ASELDVRTIRPIESDVAAPALGEGRLGLFAADRFELTTGDCADCSAPAAAGWWFRDEPIAVPKAAEDAQALPSVVWIGAPQRIAGARLSADAREVHVGERSLPLALTPRLATNAAYADASTARFFAGRALTIRGA